MFTATWMGHYIPLTWLSLGLNYALGGMQPWGYHLGNLLLHAANTTLFFFLAHRLLTVVRASVPEERGADRASRPGDVTVTLGAAAAALLWALHPLRVESVAWVTERRDVLCGFCCRTFGASPARARSPAAASRRLSPRSRPRSARRPSR